MDYYSRVGDKRRFSYDEGLGHLHQLGIINIFMWFDLLRPDG